VEYLYNNNLQEAKDYPTRVVDTAGRDRRFTYDSFGRLITATDIADAVTTYTYGDNGLTQVTGPTGETRSYGYDSLGNQTSITYGDGSTTQYSYDVTDNRLTQSTLASGNTIAYSYDSAGRIITQTATSGGTTSTTYTSDGAINTVQNSTGQIKYTYDVNGGLSGIDDPNGSSIRYERDILGRVTKITEKATPTATGAVTQYTYDAVGNLKTVIDPIGGVTTMTYDAANRLTQRLLPNGITTSYTYNLVDQILSIVHKAADGTVLASLTYERAKGGEPTKITREDGSYTQITYDASLRVTKEAYYDSNSILTETITYTHDAAGKRTAKTDFQGNHAYNYGSGFRLNTVQDANETEQYTYDADGRLSQVNRDGSNISLSHDDYDRLTQVNNATTGQNVIYLYDAQGRRIGENDGTTQRRYLVDPSMGSGLDVQDLVTDGSGNLLANYIYAGSAPLMRLDANGNPVYYLTDGMGSVIGLANGAGQSVAKYSYDGFGNIRNSSGSDSAASILGGDFRFQGQWLESESGLYYMRARDYDSNTGRFISRDPVDLIQTEPESFDPYQFVYDNPYIFTDPTGMFTLIEINFNLSTQNALSTLETYINYQAKEYLKQKAEGIITDALWSSLRSFLPIGDGLPDITKNILALGNTEDAGNAFEKALRDAICWFFEPLPESFVKNIWIEPTVGVSSGRAFSSGFNCPREPLKNKPFVTLPNNEKYAYPDFIISPTPPATLHNSGKHSWLIGDVKLSLKTLANDYKEGGYKPEQFNAIANHAKKYGTFITGFITLKHGNQTDAAGYIQEIQKTAVSHGVAALIATIFDG
jgi:RHS repeat-associated protein